MLNPYRTPSNNKYELSNILKQIDEKQKSPRTGNPLKKADIFPDNFTQKEIFKKYSNVENSEEAVKQIIMYKFHDNLKNEEIDKIYEFEYGSTNSILEDVMTKVFGIVEKEIQICNNILLKIIEYESYKEFHNENVELLKKNYKICKKRLKYKEEFLTILKHKFHNLIFLDELMDKNLVDLLDIKDRYTKNPIPAKGFDLSKVRDALNYYFRITHDSSSFADLEEGNQQDNAEEFEEDKNKSTLCNFFYPKEFTLHDSGVFKNWDKKDTIKPYIRLQYKRKASVRISERSNNDFNTLVKQLIKYKDWYFIEPKGIESLVDEDEEIYKEYISITTWSVYHPQFKIQEDVFIPDRFKGVNAANLVFNNNQLSRFSDRNKEDQPPSNEYFQILSYEKPNFPQTRNYINDIKLRYVKSEPKPFPMEMNYSVVPVEKGYLVGFGFSKTEYKTYSSLWFFSTDKMEWEECSLHAISQHGQEEVEPSDEQEKFSNDSSCDDENQDLVLQSPSTCVYTYWDKIKKKNQNYLYTFGGYVNKNKQIKELYCFDISDLDLKNTKLKYELINYDDKDEIKPRSQSKTMLHLRRDKKDMIYIYGGAFESNDSITSLSDLNTYDIKNRIMENICYIDPPRANHFFEKLSDDEIIIAFGYDYERNIPLNDFYLYNVTSKLCYNACINFNFQPEYNISWTMYKKEYVIIYGGKVHGLLMVLDLKELDNSVLQYSKVVANRLKKEKVEVKMIKSEYEVDYTKDKTKDKTKDTGKSKGKKENAGKGDKGPNPVQDDDKYLNDYLQDRGGIMVCNRDLYALPSKGNSKNIEIYDMVFTYDFHLYLN